MKCYKEPFESQEAANKAKRNVKGAKRSYKCHYCNKWHITRKPKQAP